VAARGRSKGVFVALGKVRLGNVEVSRLVIGGNPFSGFSHQGPERDKQFRKYYTQQRIKDTLRKAEQAGINTVFARADNHMIRLLEEYWDEGGKIQWIAQTASERADFLSNIRTAAANGAKGCYLHGGQSDFFFHQKQHDNMHQALATMKSAGLAAGFAGHNVAVHEWIRDNLKADFQVCCYYDPTPRTDDPNHVSSDHEKFDPAHRDQMAAAIRTFTCPTVHYKVFAAGRTDPRQALQYVAKTIRPQDIVLIGCFLGDNENMIAEDVKLFEEIVEKK
jgi:hypothetical protein